MSNTEQSGWLWSEVDPLTRSVVATFSGQIGSGEKCLSQADFFDATTQAFIGVTPEDIMNLMSWSGREGMRNALANKLTGLEKSEIQSLTQNLGRLAGGTEGALALAALVDRQFSDSRCSDAIPGMQMLSEVAITRLLRTF